MCWINDCIIQWEGLNYWTFIGNPINVIGGTFSSANKTGKISFFTVFLPAKHSSAYFYKHEIKTCRLLM